VCQDCFFLYRTQLNTISLSLPLFRHIPLDPTDHEKISDNKRKLGQVVIRGTQVSLISPQEGMEEIANPFMVGDEEEDEE